MLPLPAPLVLDVGGARPIYELPVLWSPRPARGLMMDYGKCRGCNVQIRWAKTAATGARIPLDAMSDNVHGNIIVDGRGRAHVFATHAAAVAKADALGEDETTYTSLITGLARRESGLLARSTRNYPLDDGG